MLLSGPVVGNVTSRTSPVKPHVQSTTSFLDEEFDSLSDDQGVKRKREDDFMDELIYIIDPRQADFGEIAFQYDMSLKKFVSVEDSNRQIAFRFVVHEPAKWRKPDCKFIGKKVLLFVRKLSGIGMNEGNQVIQKKEVEGVIEELLAEGSPGLPGSPGVPTPRWRVRFADSQYDQNLDESEVYHARCSWELRNGLSVYRLNAAKEKEHGKFWWQNRLSNTAAILWDKTEEKVILPADVFESHDFCFVDCGGDDLWGEMTLAEFMGLEHPFRFCDCIPLNGSTSVAAPNVVHSTGESSRRKIVQSAVEAPADSSEAERRDLVRAEMHGEFLFSGGNPGRKK